MADQKEILESIRDIIAGKPGSEPADDILDLTQVVNPDGSVTEIKPKAKPAAKAEPEKKPDLKVVEKAPEPPKAEAKPTPKPQAPAASSGGDILSEIDSLLSNTGKATKPGVDEKVELEFAPKTEKFEIAEEFEPTPAPASDENPAAQPAYGTQPIMPREEIKPQGRSMENNDTIISDQSAKEAQGAISELMGKLKKEGKEANRVEPSAPFRSGATVEDLVIEMLKPMMKDWLDKNLPKLVSEIVSKEIQKLVPRD